MSAKSVTFGQKVIDFNASLHFDASLPPGIGIMNPFVENACAMPASTAFYHKYYNDTKKRRIILGINPGRFGAGITGVPFTDPKHLESFCDIHIPECGAAHEPSSVFVYDVIEAYGGLERFYGEWYINSICPLGFVKESGGKRVNYNYYDSAAVTGAALPFILETLQKQLAFGIERDVCFCLGNGRNAAFMRKLNAKHGFFDKIVALPHPRFITQYRWGRRKDFVGLYVDELSAYAPDK